MADNKKAAYNYFFEERFEAGLVLEGWRSNPARRQGAVDGRLRRYPQRRTVPHRHPDPTRSTRPPHISPDKVRTKKLLMHKAERSGD
ncbi:MAG: SsrA-binding protein [Rhodoferax sp.]|nr:SsrA-binding protein [Rhodoferax sp.]